MGKRLRRGGGRSPFSPSGIDRSSLLRRMKSLNLDIFSEPYMLIERLRERYPDYARIKLKPFSDRINETLKSLRSSSLKLPAASSASAAAYGSSSSSSSSDSDDADEERRSRRKRIKEDASEKRLLRAESEHLRRRLSIQGGPSSSSLEPSDDLTSTSEDAVFEEKVNLEFDITKSMLRERYANQSTLRKKPLEEVRNVEIEAVVNETGKAEMAVTRKGRGQVVPLTKGVGDHSDNVQSRE
ncbi:hypothetical protein HPP92_012135 [Vanilla planifolia]|uniref:Uncharacterized protein n=1 Tax=Vanilla planifolia TaxID=51239 RepID=A0A835R756_VANPL|nr:hypothetical protein HPP92_012135 [Vanilla planifolia]